MKFKGPLVPFGLRIDYWIGPKSKAKSSLRFEPTSNPGIFLGYAVQSNFVWRKEFMVLPLKDVMESDFSAEIQPLRVHQIAVPNIGLHFACKGRYNMIREGLYRASPFQAIHHRSMMLELRISKNLLIRRF